METDVKMRELLKNSASLRTIGGNPGLLFTTKCLTLKMNFSIRAL